MLGGCDRMKRNLLLCCLLVLLVLMQAYGAFAEVTTDITPLPWDNSPGYMPNPADYTETGYADASITVDISKTRRANADIYVATVKIKHASQLRTGLAETLGRQASRVTTMAQHFNAVIALNGDYYSERKTGLAIRQGETLLDNPGELYDILLIDSEGDFHIVKRDNLDMLDVYLSGALDIRNAFTFGPALVIDGVKQEIPEKYSFAAATRATASRWRRLLISWRNWAVSRRSIWTAATAQRWCLTGASTIKNRPTTSAA